MSNWGEYDNFESEYSFNNIKEEKLINEAIQLIFLRKYHNLKIKENELIKIFEECNYNDSYIIEKINDCLYHQTNHKKNHSKKIINNSRYKNFSKKNKKKNKKKNNEYKEREIELEDKNEEIIIENNRKNSLSTNESENIDLKRYYSSDNKKNIFENYSYLPQNNLYVNYLLSSDSNFFSNENTHLERSNLFTKNNNNDKYAFNWDKIIEFYKFDSSSF